MFHSYVFVYKYMFVDTLTLESYTIISVLHIIWMHDLLCDMDDSTWYHFRLWDIPPSFLFRYH